MAEQRGRRAVAVQRGAVHLHKFALHLVAGLLQLIHAPRQMRLARTRGPREQDRRARAHRHPLHLVDQGVKAHIARGNAAFQELHRILLLGAKALRDHVVAREVQVDQRVAARVTHLLALGR